MTPYEQIGSFLPDEYRPYYMIISIFSVLFLIVISRLINRYDNLFDRYFIGFSFCLLWLNLRKKQTLSKKQIKALMERKEFLQNSIKNKKVIDYHDITLKIFIYTLNIFNRKSCTMSIWIRASWTTKTNDNFTLRYIFIENLPDKILFRLFARQ